MDIKRNKKKKKEIKKDAQRRLEQILQANTAPMPEADRRHALIRRLAADAAEMSCLREESFAKKVLTIGSYFSPWTWAAQAALLVLFFYCSLAYREALMIGLFCLAPGLVLILLCELSKTFGNHMWEMEAACRYNLPRLFFLRLTLLSGADLLILTGALVIFRMSGGKLWQFAVNALLPFFLLSALCLWLIKHFGSRCSRMGLLGVVILAENMLWYPCSRLFETFDLLFGDTAAQKAVLCATAAALLLYLCSAVSLCAKKYYGNTRKENKLWSLE